MAQLTLPGLYLGDQYNIMGEVLNDYFTNGSPDYEERTGLELLIVKHTILATEKMKNQGDYVLDWTSKV